ncbi:uncharacterized protein BJ171DRAFT_144885 [Polychytrium aggregatum]|uniref:uncharacterized protein n=1 Tax=Polychytrium aggregatum TaxID=110093 RepID=UPI0022FE1FAD|nr:uncharacterized protein BJ171DRAFT_144885 [Polychytrium aggregatum]KAI9203503.1 hypothetical protein BJ171DRAFT_144885 [Polychytrium aggregatum]
MPSLSSVLEARKLPNPTSSVLYCVVTVGKEGDKTTKVNAESNPLWLEEFSFPWTTRSAQSVPGILVDIYRSRLLRDELIGSVFIPIHAVTNRYLKQWIPLESSDQRGALGEAEILIEAIYVNPIEIDDDDDPRPALQSSLQSRHEPRNVPDVKPKFNPRNLVLSDVLDRNEAMMEFIQFMESCQVGAYAQYFIMVNSFQQLANAAETSPAIFRSDAIDVYDMFFSKDAKYPISIPGDSEIAARVLDRIVSDPSPNVFEEITEVLKAHVQQQYWQAFKESEFFEEYLATTGSSPTAASMPAPPRNDGTPTPPPRSLLEESIIQEPAIRPIDPFEVVEPARGTPPVDIAGRGDALDRLNATEPTHIIEPAAVAVPETVPSRPSSNASPALPPRQTNLPAANTLAPDVSTAPPPKPPRRRAETSPPPAAPSSEPALPPPKPPRPVRSATIQKAPEVTSSTKPLTDNLDFLSSEIPGNLFTAPAAAVQEGDGSILAPDPDPVPAPAAVPVLDGSSNVGTAQPNLLGDDEPLSAAVQPTPAHPASRDIDIDTNADIGTNPSSAAPVQSHTMDAVAPRASPRTFDSEYRRNLRSAIAAGQDEALAISIALESSSGYEAIQYKRSKAEIESRIEILGRFLAEEERYLQAAAESGWALPEDPVSLVGVRVTIQDITGDGSDDAPVDGRDGVLSNFAGTLGAVSNKGLLFLVQVNRVGSQQRWSLYRSYADWVLLSDVLKPQFAFIRSNPVPNRPRISHAKSRETLAVELEKWTNMLLMDRDLSKTAQLRAFLLEQTLEALSGGQRPSIPSEAGGNGPDSLQQSFVRALKKGGSMLQKLGFETDSEDDWDSSDPRLIEKDSSLYMHPNHSGSAASITGQSLSHDRAATAPVIGRQPSLRSLAPEQDSVLDPPKMARASSRGKMAPYVNPSVAGAKTILRATSPSVIPDRKLSYVVRFSPEDTKVVLESAVQTIEEVLNLNDPNQWILQKGLHAAKALLRRTYGTTISNYVENYLTDLSQPAEVASYIELAIRAGWPNEAAAQGNGTAAGLRNARSQQDLAGSSFVAPPSSLSSEPPRPRTELEMEDTKLSAKTVLLKDFVSQLEAVSRVFGKSNVTSGCARVFNMLQVKELNAILTVSILRAVIDEVFSDVPRSSS